MGERIWIADAHRDYGKRSIVPADEKLTVFLELESALPKKPQACWKTIDDLPPVSLFR
jgi:hypothetical protein